MRVGSQLLQTIQQAEDLLQRFDLPPEAVGPVVQEFRFRDQWTDTRGRFDSLLQSNDFKLKFNEALNGESYRAEECDRVKEKFQTLMHRDTFQAFRPAMVTFKAADLQRVCIRG